jgi:hypothetical protein
MTERIPDQFPVKGSGAVQLVQLLSPRRVEADVQLVQAFDGDG